LTERPKSLERALEEAVSRALRDNLAPLQRTADELHQAYADLVAACSSTRPSNALPAMLRAQTAASSLAAGLSVLSNFVAVALKSRDHHGAAPDDASAASTAVMDEADEVLAQVASERREAELESEPEWELETPEVSAEVTTEVDPPKEAVAEVSAAIEHETAASDQHAPVSEEYASEEAEAAVAPPAAPVVEPEVPAFEVGSLPTDLQDLHRRANRVAKVAMQDIQLLRPKDVRLGREHKDLCDRLRSDLDKARKEYDRRFRTIQDHPVDYFHRWMVEILAAGDEQALGEYPYPSPVLRH
jgi:hypothetical protein